MLIDGKHEPQFSQPVRQILLMVLALCLVGVGGFLLYPAVEPIFWANPFLNGVILAVFVFGVLACFGQVLMLISAVNWIEGFALDRPGHEFTASPRLLASLAALLRNTDARRSLTSTSTRSILDSVATRLDEVRDITRYIVNLLIFLGLLGTFFGLATTVPAVVDTIRSLAPQEGASALDVFDNLMTGLEEQLGGMGTAFASSLLGLAGSLVVGLLELFAGHGQNRFYSELEEWLSSITKISLSNVDGDGVGSEQMATVLEQMLVQMDMLRETVRRSEDRRADADERMMQLTSAVGALAERMGTGGPAHAPAPNTGASDALVQKMVDSQEKMSSALISREEESTQAGAEMRMRLRNIDVQMLRILEEMAAGRQDSVAELRQDIQTLTETLRSAIREG